MSEQDPDNTASTPLDLLLNAIIGSGQHAYLGENQEGRGAEGELSFDGFLGGQNGSEGTLMPAKRPRDEDGGEMEQVKIAKTLTSHIIFSSQANVSQGDGQAIKLDGSVMSTISSIQVWHPKTALKSYGKERRVFTPPPFLRVDGPLLPQLTMVTLSTTSSPYDPANPSISASQTYHIPITAPEEIPIFGTISGTKPKKAERDDRKRKILEAANRSGFGGALSLLPRLLSPERQALKDGLNFPGLWAGEEKGRGKSRGKEYRLELSIGMPGISVPSTEGYDARRVTDAQVDQEAPPSASEADGLHDVLDPSTMDGLDILAAHDTAEPTASTLDGHLQGITENATNQLPAASFDPSLSDSAPVSQPLHSWATFTSEPINLVTKPSQKTAKARSIDSCMSVHDTVALWVRINSQSVRTKYMKLEEGPSKSPYLAAKSGKWTPFRFEIVRRAIPPNMEKPRKRQWDGGDRLDETLTYGSEVILVDVQTGVKSEVVKIVKVEKGETLLSGEDYGDPVSELQRVGFVRVDATVGNEGGRWYLSAPGARMGGGELRNPDEIAHRASRRRVSQLPPQPTTLSDPSATESLDALASATIPDTLDAIGDQTINPAVEPDLPLNQEVLEASLANLDSIEMPLTDGVETLLGKTLRKKVKTKRNALAFAAAAENEEGSMQAALTWSQATSEVREIDGGKAVGKRSVMVEKVEDWMCWVLGTVSCFSYSFFDGFSGFGSIPSTSLNPIPQILAPPDFRASNNVLHLILSDFEYPDESNIPRPLDIYLGPIGPLTISLWRSTASVPADKSLHPLSTPAEPLEPGREKSSAVMSNFPSNVKHVLVVVEMPDAGSILHTMEACVAETASPPPDAPGPSAPWLGEEVPHGQMTLEDALMNAERGETSGFESIMLEEGMIDPALQAEGSNPSAQLNTDANVPASSATEAKLDFATNEGPPLVILSVPERETKKAELASLPLLLVRRSDGVGFGIGRSVVAERLDQGDGAQVQGGGDGSHWGLRVVETDWTARTGG